MEREWEEEQKKKAEDRASGIRRKDDDDKGNDSDDDLPFACFICRQLFVNPVVTKCKHYFCEKCALEHHAKDKKCFICKEPTLGIFNQPKKLIAKVEAKKQKELKKMQNADVDDDTHHHEHDHGNEDE
jgi:RING finger protein 113A